MSGSRSRWFWVVFWSLSRIVIWPVRASMNISRGLGNEGAVLDVMITDEPKDLVLGKTVTSSSTDPSRK